MTPATSWSWSIVSAGQCRSAPAIISARTRSAGRPVPAGAAIERLHAGGGERCPVGSGVSRQVRQRLRRTTRPCRMSPIRVGSSSAS